MTFVPINASAVIETNAVDAARWDRAAFDWPLNTARHPAQPPRLGTAGTNILKGNGINNWDVSILKNTRITEWFRLEFRFEMFNAFNHPSFADPVTGPENPQFGRTFATSTDPRDIQFGLKFYW